MNNRYMFLLLGLLIIISGCSEERSKIEQLTDDMPSKTIKVSATVEGEESGTRLSMAQDGLDVKFTWDVGDEIKLIFTDGINVVQGSTTVSTVSNNGKRAEFDVDIPAGSTSSTFDLYGYFGSGALSAITGEEAIANLPPAPWAATLPLLEGAELVMLRFAATDLDIESPEISVAFQHVGSLFKIFIENTSPIVLNGVTNVDIFTETEGAVIYAHQNNGTNTVKYDVINDLFIDGTTAFTNQLSFITSGGSDDISPGEVMELWGWFPPSQESGHVWPELKLRLNYSGGELITNDNKPPRVSPTAIGRAYHFYATYDGADLSFSDVYKQKLIDSRDMSQYNIVEIGNQTWMAENLRFYPFDVEVSDPEIESTTQPLYYVYGFQGDFEDPEALQTFSLSGLLYNWAAAFEGEAGSDTNPSGVKGICPEGWHLPSEAEWQELIDFVETDHGNKLKDKLWWEPTSSSITNEYGFTARPGGIRNNQTPFYSFLTTRGYWITSDIVSATEMRVVSISSNENEFTFVDAPKGNAASVRCIKD